MTFASLSFLIFFPLVGVFYYALPDRFRPSLLLLASCYFYMAFVPQYILILFALILIDFTFAQYIATSEGRKKKLFFLGSLVANIGILFVFKYFNFFNANITALAYLLHWNYSIGMLRLLLPLGLSFHTFQSVSYVIEVYRGTYPPERNLGIYALYVLFFPQLIAGPIERPEQLLPQFHAPHPFNASRVWSGLRLMGWGFFKKLVIADRLALSVDYVYAHIPGGNGPAALIAIAFFAFQLYADFSGYTDIARGAARTLGYELVLNFNRPYTARSIAEFWRRWHISLSSWFRDYLYFPLAYSAKRASRQWLYICIIITFLVTGLWHGAGWTFVIMGGLHGTYLVIGTMTKSMQQRLKTKLGLDRTPRFLHTVEILWTFSLVSFSWVFFRAPDVQTAFALLREAASGWALSFSTFLTHYVLEPAGTLGISRADLILSVVGICVLLTVEQLSHRFAILRRIEEQSLFVRTGVYATLVLSILAFGIFETKQFIYFQF
jgi:D-alanyl-lipoteichoic acid acyltransferase DltB (MBOAT superfamily)